jgi:hypothetical protein
MEGTPIDFEPLMSAETVSPIIQISFLESVSGELKTGVPLLTS